MASLSELMKKNNAMAGSSEPAGSTGKSLSQLMGIPTKSEVERLSIQRLNESRQRSAMERLQAARTADWEEQQRQQALRDRYVYRDSLVGRMMIDRAHAAEAAQRNQKNAPGVDDNSLAFQMLKDRAQGEKNGDSSLLDLYWQSASAPDSLAGAAIYNLTNGFKPNRASNVVKGNVKDYVGSIVSAIGTLAQSVANTPAQQYEPKTGLDQWAAAVGGMHDNPVVFAMNQIRSNKESAEAVMELGQDARDYGSKISDEGKQLVQDQKEGLGKVGQTLVDVGSVGTQMALDIGLGWLSGLGMAAPMALRVFGSSAEKSAKEGANLNQQLAYSFGTAAVAYGIEHLCNVAMSGLKVIAPGIGDDFVMSVVDKLALKLAKTPAGATALKTIGTLFASGSGEGFEEILEDFIEPYLQKITYNKDAKSVFEDPGQLVDYLYDGFLGFVMGATGSGVNVTINTGANSGADGDMKAAYEEYRGIFTDQVVNDAYESLKQNGMFSQKGQQTIADANKTLEGYEPSWQKTDGVRHVSPGIAAQVDENDGQGEPQKDALGVSEQGSAPAQVEQKNAPAAAERAQGMARDPIQVIREANEKAKAQQNEKTAAETQRDVFESNTEAKAPGFYKNDRFGGTDKDAEYLDRLAKAAGVSIEMSEAKDGSNGWILNGEVHLSENAEDPLRVVAKHEITHHLRDAAGEAYGQFRNYVEEIYRSRGSLEQQIASIQQLYRENGQELSKEEALDELAADYAGELMDNEALIYKLAGENRNLAQRFLDGIRNLIRKIKTAFGSEEMKQLDRAEKLWSAALQEANAAYQRREIVPNVDVKNSFADKKIPTYDELIAKPDIKIVDIRNSGGSYSKENRFIDSENAKKQFEQPFYNKDTGEYVFIHKGSFTKSFSENGSDKAALAEHLSEIVENAVLTHSDTSRKSPNDHTTGVYTLFAAVQTDSGVRPVRLKVKEYRMEGQDIPSNIKEYFLIHGESDPYASAYAGKVLVLEEINKEEASSSASSTTEKPIADQYPSASSEISVRDLLALVNMEYQKYIPQERQSVKGSREMQRRIDALERQNQRLREQMKRTDTPKQNRKAVENTANALAKEYSSKIDRKVLADRLENLYDGIYQQGSSKYKSKLTAEQIRSESKSIANAILDQSTAYANPLYREYGTLRSQIRNEEIFIAKKDREELRYFGYDGYEDFKKRNSGRLKFSENGRSVESLYRELNEKNADLFPDDMFTPAEQVNRISEVLTDLDTLARDPYAFNRAETVDFLAGEIEERYYQTERKELTFADKEEQKRQRMRETDKRLFDAQLYAVGRQHQREVKAVQERYAEANRERIEKQNAAQRRKTIYRSAGRLANKLLRPTNKQHVPEELRGAAYNLLQYINLESGFELSYGKGATYHRVKKGTELDAEPNSRTLAALDLKAKLKEMAGNESLTIDPDMEDYLDQIASMGNKTLQQMSRAELDTVWNVVQIVEHTISRANELHEIGRYENLSQMADALQRATEGRKQRTDYVKAVGALDKLINFDMIDEATFFHRLGKPGDEIFRMMRKAEDRQTRILAEGVAQAQKLLKESGVDFAKADKELHTFSLGGNRKITLSKSQIMELYALSRRQQAKDHIIKGGLKAVGAAKGIISQDNVHPVVVNWTEVGQIISKLTDKEKNLMDGLQSYLSNELSKHGNEETMKVYGYKKFKEKHYWPIKVSNTETSSNPSKAAHAKTIPGYGMTKNVQPKAKNPVELHSAMDTFTQHLNQMATYSAWLGTNEDITRLLNYQYDGADGDTENTVKRILATVYGKNGEKYINDLLSDIAQGTKTGQDKALTDSLFARWKAAKVGANIRVVVQQPTAILRAMAVMDPKYMATAKSAKKGWEKAKKYAAIAQWKDWGYFEIGTGRSLRELITGSESFLDDVKNASMWAAGAMDSVSWGFLWNSAENEISDKQPSLKPGSEEFYHAVADRFSEIIDRTQVVDSVLHRTQIMRSGNALNKMATGFMSEPSKIYNMVARNIYDLVDADSDAKKKAVYKALRRSSAALITSFAVNALVQSLIDALRDDDRDKDYWEKFGENYLGITGEEKSFSDYWGNFWSGNFWQNFNPLSYVPYVKDVLSIVQGYEVDRSDMAAISDLATALQQFGKSISGEGKKTVLVTGLDAAAKLGDLLGLPVSNLKREVTAIINTILNEAELYELQYELDKIVYNEENASGVFFGDLYRTMNNDYDAYEDIYDDMYERMIERGYEKDEAADKISDAMENKMKKDLGVESVKSLPVRYTPPTSEDPEDPFLTLMKKARENDTNWVEALDPGSIEIALAVDSIRDAETLEKIRMVAEQPYGEDLKRLAMRNFMGDSQWGRYLSALNAGVSSKQYAEFLEAIAKEAQRRTGKEDADPSQADIRAVLEKSKMNSKQKRALWNGYGWKAESPW